MNPIKCAFVDFWDGFQPEQSIASRLLFDRYEVVIDFENPDYLFYSCFGREHYRYDSCIKIFWSGENIEPNFNECDYAVTYSRVLYGDRAFYQCYDNYTRQPLPMPSEEALLNRKFCNFIYSNSLRADPMREKFFNELSKYKKIDSAGEFLNNTGYRVPMGDDNKINFQSQYKFTLAIENSSMPGYATEKIHHPFLAHSLPVYWGDPSIESTYNPASFVNTMNFSSVEEAVNEVIRLDKDNAAYMQKITAPFWGYGDSLEAYRLKNKTDLCVFYDSIFSQPKETAFRRTMYGRVMLYRQEQSAMKPHCPTLFERITQKITRRIKSSIFEK